MDAQQSTFPENSLLTAFPGSGDGATELAPEALLDTVDTDTVIVDEVQQEPEHGRLRTLVGKGVTALKLAAITAEILPITNEGSRFGAFAYAQTITHNPVVGAAVLGTSTLLVEGAGVLAASDWIAKDRIKDAIDRVDEKLDGTKFSFLSPKHYIPEDVHISPIAEAGLAMTAGSIVTLEAKQREDPSRTAEQNRRRGMFIASSMAGVFAVEGALLAEGVDHYTSPTSVGAALLGVAGLVAFTKWAKKRMTRSETTVTEIEEDTMSSQEVLGITEASTGVELDDVQLAAAADLYETHRREEDGPILVGLYGEDLHTAMKDLGTVMVKYAVAGSEEPVHAPLLVPTPDMEWYNLPYLHERFGEETPLYCYVHPPVPEDEGSSKVVADAVQKVLDDGAVVLFEQYRGYPVLDGREWDVEQGPDTVLSQPRSVVRDGENYQLEGMNSDRREKRSDIFVGKVNFNGIETVKEAEPLYDVYKHAVEEGTITVDRENGPVLEDVMSEEDAARIWQIYEKPFERLSKGNPVLAGFDQESLKALLLDPGVVKVVNRSEGEITTVGIFSQNFEQCPWFNADFFKREYPEYYNTGNILMCPSIVSDEERRGHTYSWALVNQIAQVCAQRGSNILLAFECTEISTRYIPDKVVERGVAASGVGVVEGFKEPVSVMEYKAVRKTVEA